MPSLFVKNMVCRRCVMMVEQELERLGIEAQSVKLGGIDLKEEINEEQREQLAQSFAGLGFEIIDDKRSRTIERIKNLIIELVQEQDAQLDIKLSEYLSRQLHSDYSALSKLFSAVEGMTIEQFYIAQKIEKIKELLVYDELSLSEIADMFHYSSVAYLSNQFKKVTGLSPSHFKKIKAEKRKSLDEI